MARKRTQLVHLRRCLACGRNFETVGIDLCAACVARLPYTNFWHQVRSPLQDTQGAFHDAVHILPLCYYTDAMHFRELIRRMKYYDRYDLARYFGCLYAQRVGEGIPLGTFDAVVPVPLHWYKLFKRGYNQCTHLAQGIACEWGLPVWPLLRRRHYTMSQTRRRNAQERERAVHGVFGLCRGAERFEGHVLLVDDVLTTGATISECVTQLRRLPRIRYSIGVLAVARRLCRGHVGSDTSGGMLEDVGEERGEWVWYDEESEREV